MRVMAVDFGSKRIGIAVGVTDAAVATPKSNLTPTGTLASDAKNITALAKQLEVEAIVVGIPLNEDNNRMALICQKLAQLIREQGLTVFEVDESLTSVEAESHLQDMDFTAAQRRQRRDGEAACVLLERYFAQT